ncbi:MAG: type II secretion system F family protein [Acetobacterales bacterium]
MAVDPVLVALGAGAAAASGALGFALFGRDAAARRFDDRIDLVRRTRVARSTTAPAPTRLLNQPGEPRFPLLEKLLLGLVPRPAAMRARLLRTGRPIGIGGYLILNLVLFVMAGATAVLALNQPPALALTIAVAVGIGLPHLAVSRMIRRREEAFINQLPEALDLLVRGVKSGLPVTELIGLVGQEMGDPVGTEFRRAADGMKLGLQIEEALWSCVRRMDVAEFKFFVISLSVQRETGGNLTETLENLAELLRRRRQMQLKVRAMSSEARASAYILGSLPFIMLGILMLLNPDYIGPLFEDPRGQMMSVVGVLVMGAGILVMAKMIKFEI